MVRDAEPIPNSDLRSEGGRGRWRFWAKLRELRSRSGFKNSVTDGVIGGVTLGLHEQTWVGAVVGFALGVGVGATLRSYLTRYDQKLSG